MNVLLVLNIYNIYIYIHVTIYIYIYKHVTIYIIYLYNFI